jgi:hypothetical protein
MKDLSAFSTRAIMNISAVNISAEESRDENRSGAPAFISDGSKHHVESM